MKLQTLIGGIAGVAIALIVGLVLLDRLDQVYSTKPPRPTSFLALLAGVGAVTGGAIASPLPEVSENNTKSEDV